MQTLPTHPAASNPFAWESSANAAHRSGYVATCDAESFIDRAYDDRHVCLNADYQECSDFNVAGVHVDNGKDTHTTYQIQRKQLLHSSAIPDNQQNNGSEVGEAVLSVAVSLRELH